MIFKIFSDVSYDFLFSLVILYKCIIYFTGLWIFIPLNLACSLKKKQIPLKVFVATIK
jgi:hypothetical protein